ncbi:hypothetical protein JCM1840_001768 [Sporobolomyces johnsonii]
MAPQSTVITPLSRTLPTNTNTTREISLPFRPFSSGVWTLSFETAIDSWDLIPYQTLKLEWSECEESVEVQGGTLWFARKRKEGRGERVDRKVEKGRFPPDRDGRLVVSKSSTYSSGEETAEVQLELEVVTEEMKATKEEATAASRTLALLDGSQSLDVCLVFSREGRKLWASSKALAGVSPYWQTQLSSSGFCEDIEDKGKPIDMAGIFDASDDELDDNPSSSPRTLADSPPPPPGTRTISIKGTSYKTYNAFLCWLYTSQLKFAPLTSTFLFASSSEAGLPISPSDPAPSSLLSARHARRSALAALSPLYSSFPPAVSPKSLYRLAHFLEIPALQSLCVSGLIDNLTVDNVPREMLGSFAAVYEEVWDVEIQFARERWEEVRVGQGMRSEEERMKGEGATGHEVETLLRLYGD